MALAKLSSCHETEAKGQPFTFLDATLRVGASLVERAISRDVTPLRGEVEFPEVFSRENPGFDGVVGNPPFLGGTRISSTLGKEYLEYLLALHPGAHGNGDLVAHFFRRAFGLLRQGGTLGMLATAAVVERTTGKKAAMKMRNTAGGSPMPSQRIAKGIHASGERLRKKLTSGRKASRALAECPSSNPAGTPRPTARTNPRLTRNSDAMASLTSLKFDNSATRPCATAHGVGNSDSGNRPIEAVSAHRATRAAGRA